MDKQEQQVWQRVLSCREEGPKNDLHQLRREAMELAAIYQNLSARLVGSNHDLMRRLYAGEKANSAALTGIERLSRRDEEGLKLWQPGNEEPRKILEKCYHRTRRCMTEYLARSADGEFGIVFERMAKREGAHCVWIAEVIGNLK